MNTKTSCGSAENQSNGVRDFLINVILYICNQIVKSSPSMFRSLVLFPVA